MDMRHRPIRRGTPERRQAILRGARTVFGSEGYTRASIDAIAAEAGVSTRTLYNHFTDKESLFRTVLLESAASVSAATEAVFERHFRTSASVEQSLLDLALDWARQSDVHPEHFALVRQIIPEGPRLPADVLKEWERIGPRATRAALERRLLEVGRQGLLAIDAANSAQAARHLAMLIGGGVMTESYFGALPLSDEQIEGLVTDGARIFLQMYARTGDAGPGPV
ncbi:hypothetical protein DB35_13410 [Streptomyces abyssalis]|uniref:HTH tetR-type domain-containing protein n=2 Tax=Streptomyces abyssalis TaxID=933944 RepID=A0A1E7JIP4_9ACTN|nr:hypothetical protein AN215_24575 [Streptomyces abyssalis]OEU93318.1 hypothetical protein DB35_13410 [Streptomyces abyssalis]OEV30545.1 hypothetical protein AN219_10485 [Streptomyces nanshensis]